MSIRKLIQHFVPKTKTQGLSEFLTLPDLRPHNSDPDDPNFNKTLTHFSPRTGALSDLKMDDEPDEFRPGPSPFQSTVPEISPLTTANDELEEWVPRTLTPPPLVQEEKYEVEIANVQLPPEPPSLSAPELDTLPLMGKPRRAPPPPPPVYAGPPPQIQLDHKQLGELIRNELRPILENAIAKTLPEIAERVIREEIEKLMRDTEQEL